MEKNMEAGILGLGLSTSAVVGNEGQHGKEHGSSIMVAAF